LSETPPGATNETAHLTDFANAVRDLRGVVLELSENFPTPEFVTVGKNKTYRHSQQHRTPQLACFLKAVKLCSTLRAAVSLVGIGHTHEAYALCRISDEQGEDIIFLVMATRPEAGQISANAQRVLTDFYQEEFSDPEDPFSSVTRDRVPRQKIRAAIFGSPEFGGSNPSTAVAVGRSVAQTFSGFVHGAYVHIIDMFGPPGMYYMAGFKETPRMGEALGMLPSYIFRGMMSVEALCFSIGRHDLVAKLKGLGSAFYRRHHDDIF
jgi:hypothetical protein